MRRRQERAENYKYSAGSNERNDEIKSERREEKQEMAEESE